MFLNPKFEKLKKLYFIGKINYKTATKYTEYTTSNQTQFFTKSVKKLVETVNFSGEILKIK